MSSNAETNLSHEKQRCLWSRTEAEIIYHDHEWGRPVADDRRIFEKISLEGFQAGLNWRTILVKRDDLRSSFYDFDIDAVANFTEQDIKRLLDDVRIIRHRGKIEAVINNAQQAKNIIQEEGSLANFIWRYEPDQSMTKTKLSAAGKVSAIALAKDLKKYRWRFVGQTTLYAFMQAIGMVNDHDLACDIRHEVEMTRQEFRRPCQR